MINRETTVKEWIAEANNEEESLGLRIAVARSICEAIKKSSIIKNKRQRDLERVFYYLQHANLITVNFKASVEGLAELSEFYLTETEVK